MAQKLKQMKYTSVDVVKRGANPDADIKILKSMQEGGDNNLTGFEKIAIMIAKALNLKVDSIQGVEKALDQAVHNEVFFSTYALNESISNVLSDNSLTAVQKMDALKENLEDFNEDIAKSFESWTDGQATDIAKSLEMTDIKLEALKKSREKLDEIIKAAEGGEEQKLKEFLDEDDDEDEDPEEDFDSDDGEDDPEEDLEENIKLKKGDESMATIDVSKMAPEDVKILEEIQKKYAGTEAEADVQNSAEVHPEVKKALDEVAELKKSMELEKMVMVAKKYEVIGKKADELAPKLYELKKAGEDHYNDFVAILDEMVASSANSEIFKEFGSGGKAGATDLDGVVAELRKSMPNATQAELVVKAYETNPNLDPYTGKLK